MSKSFQINRAQSLERKNYIIDQLLAGTKTRRIVDYLVEKYNVVRGRGTVLIHQAKKEIVAYRKEELDNLYTLHLTRYEYLFKQLMDRGFRTMAMSSLQQKEKLLGMHKEEKNVSITVANEMQIRFVSDFDVDKLNDKEKQRYNYLVKKAS